jgi:hypothetical protein
MSVNVVVNENVNQTEDVPISVIKSPIAIKTTYVKMEKMVDTD